jgi:16S rRNA (guanine(966)-N(2))-methyltransferase RsmD
MRIISGRYRGKTIHPPKVMNVRPTTDLAKESLFNILINTIDLSAVSVLDLFAGTGSISYEFASRGCTDITAVDIETRNCTFIRKTSGELQFGIKVYHGNAFAFLKHFRRKFGIIFADPPYQMKETCSIPGLVFDTKILEPGGVLIIEHSPATCFSEHPHFSEHREYGKVNFSFFKALPARKKEM